jgi:hypothetical protein
MLVTYPVLEDLLDPKQEHMEIFVEDSPNLPM